MSDHRIDGPRLLRELCALSVRGLAAVADRHTGLFPHKVVLSDGHVEARGENALYSAISLIGLMSAGRDDLWTDAVSVGRALDTVTHAGLASGDASLAGAVLWALALAGDRRVRAMVDRVERFDGNARTTMEVAFVVSGAVAAMEHVPGVRDRAARIADAGVRVLLDRWSPSAALFAAPRTARPRRSSRGT